MSTEIIITIISTLGVGAILERVAKWFFGDKQNHDANKDNDSHQREKDYFEMVDKRAEKEVQKEVQKILSCTELCDHADLCPVQKFWRNEKEEK